MNERAIKKLRRKFVLTALISFVSVMVLMCLTIYSVNIITTAWQISHTLDYIAGHNGELTLSDEMSEQIAEEMRPENRNFFVRTFQDMFNTGFSSTEFIYSVRYFSVTYDSNDQPVKVVANHIAMVNDRRAKEIAGKALSSGKDWGMVDGFPYEIYQNGDQKLVVGMDISNQVANIRRIGSISIAITLVGSILAFVILRLISGRVIKPEIQAVEQQKQFITNASHELKTPLAVIRANTELEMMMHGEDEWNQSTMNQVDRMTDLIKNLVQVAKAEETDDKQEREEIDVSQTVSGAVEPFSSVASQSGKKLEADIPEGISMKAVADQISQLTTLLVDNAIKYCDDGGTVSVKLAQKGKGITLKVSNDYAEGKDADYGKFFDRFYRRDESHNIDKGGYGIGLSIAQAIVSKYRGSIDAVWKDGVICFTCRLKG